MRWSPGHDRAAKLVAGDHETDEAIAARAGVDDPALRRWKAHPQIAARAAAAEK